MYPTLESRIFHSYLLQAAPTFATCSAGLLGEDEWLSLYRWTQYAYRYFSAYPDSIVKETHEDDGYLRGMRTIDKPKLKPNMRKSLQAMNGLLKVVWDFVSIGEIQNNALLLPEGASISPKNLELLGYTGIAAAGRSLLAQEYPGMFTAIRELTLYPDGFQRLVRCAYDENAEVLLGAYQRFAGDEIAFARLVTWLREQSYRYTATLDDSEVRNFESSRISFMKNITGATTTVFPGYDHEHFGFLAYFDALKLQPVAFRLFLQRVRDVLADFENIGPRIQKFILDNHARCNGCGYCTQRSKGKQTPYTIHVNFEDHTHALCPINHVYTYHWQQINDDLATCIIAFLSYFEAKFNNLHSWQKC